MTSKEMLVAVSVASLWTTPDAPRAIDRAALGNRVDPRAWLEPMTIADRLDLCDSSRLETQALYGSRVQVIEERADWIRVVVPDQRCRKDPRGYPGWVPKVQLASPRERAAAPSVVVSQPIATLFTLDGAPAIELSYATQLPVLGLEANWIRVLTPHGERLLRSRDVGVLDPAADGDPEVGLQMLEDCRLFFGLHYLWAGASAFGFDCSGLTYTVHRRRGILIPRDASDQALSGQPVETSELAAGDLLFFAHERGKGAVHHVAMYAGAGQMIHAPNSAKCIELVDIASHELAPEHVASRRYW